MSRLIYKKASNDKGALAKKIAKICVFVLYLTILLPISCIIFVRQKPVVVPVRFNSCAWKSDISLRKNMVHDLLAGHTVMGLKDVELDELLGPPDGRPWGTEFDPDAEYYKLQRGDLWKNGKYIELIGFKIKNNRVIGSTEALEKYW